MAINLCSSFLYLRTIISDNVSSSSQTTVQLLIILLNLESCTGHATIQAFSCLCQQSPRSTTSVHRSVYNVNRGWIQSRVQLNLPHTALGFLTDVKLTNLREVICLHVVTVCPTIVRSLNNQEAIYFLI